MKTFLFFCGCFFLMGCNSINNNSHLYGLRVSDKEISIPIDNDTKIYTRAMHHFTDTTGIEYITIENSESVDEYNTINFYRLDSCRLSHKVKIVREGTNGVSRFWGHGICDLDNIFLAGFGHNVIYQINRKGELLSKKNFDLTNKNEPTTGFDFNSLIYRPMIIKDSKIYGVQFPLSKNIGGDDFKNIPLCITIDTCTGVVEKKQLSYPRLWENGGKMGYNTHCSCIFDGKNFVYAFCANDNIIVTTDHITSKTYPVKSRYIDKVYNEGYPNDLSFDEFNKAYDENAVYGNFIYDSYRDVYYRFAYPKCTVKKNTFEYIFCRKEFSIIIVDSKFNIIGETLFPPNKYAPGLFFINKDGLYLSENNIDNPSSSENLLKFRCLILKPTM